MAKEQSEIVLQNGTSIEIAFCVQGGMLNENGSPLVILQLKQMNDLIRILKLKCKINNLNFSFQLMEKKSWRRFRHLYQKLCFRLNKGRYIYSTNNTRLVQYEQ